MEESSKPNVDKCVVKISRDVEGTHCNCAVGAWGGLKCKE